MPDEIDVREAILPPPTEWESMWVEANRRLRAMFPTRQITKIFADGDYLQNAELDGTDTSSGLLPINMMPAEVYRCIPKNLLPSIRPVITAVGLKPLTGAQSYDIIADLTGRRVTTDAIIPAGTNLRGTIPVFNQAGVPFFSAFNVPVPVDTEAGYHPYHLRIQTNGKTGVAIATLNYQWDLVSFHGGGDPGTHVVP
jgi:hypothetical protein